jgi:hypothetical protein
MKYYYSIPWIDFRFQYRNNWHIIKQIILT